MRELKFRAWDKTNKRMIDWEWLELYESDGFRVIDAEGVVHHLDGILMQFTGLKDKNGKETYCSDLVKGYFKEEVVEDWMWIGLTDKEKEQGFRIFEIPDNIVEASRLSLPDELEVIGNIYEDSNLLKEIEEK